MSVARTTYFVDSLCRGVVLAASSIRSTEIADSKHAMALPATYSAVDLVSVAQWSVLSGWLALAQRWYRRSPKRRLVWSALFPSARLARRRYQMRVCLAASRRVRLILRRDSSG